MIQIQPFSFISSMSLYFIALYLRTIHQLFKIKLQLTHLHKELFVQLLILWYNPNFSHLKMPPKELKQSEIMIKEGKLSLLENILIMNCCLEITILFSVSLIEPMIIL